MFCSDEHRPSTPAKVLMRCDDSQSTNHVPRQQATPLKSVIQQGRPSTPSRQTTPSRPATPSQPATPR